MQLLKGIILILYEMHLHPHQTSPKIAAILGEAGGGDPGQTRFMTVAVRL